MKDFLKKLLPENTYQMLRTAYKENITHYQRDIYSEFGEDFTAAVLLGFKKNGFYVDVGAFKPKELSATYYFYKKLGWSGVVVEPNPTARKLFKSQRPRDIFVNKGVSNQTGELAYYEFQDPTLNSFSKSVYERNREIFVGKKRINVKSLKDILDENISYGQEIDLMNIDVEGLDYQVLESNDWTKYSPKVLIIEDHAFDPENPLKSRIVTFLKDKGYSLKASCLISLIFYKD